MTDCIFLNLHEYMQHEMSNLINKKPVQFKRTWVLYEDEEKFYPFWVEGLG